MTSRSLLNQSVFRPDIRTLTLEDGTLLTTAVSLKADSEDPIFTGSTGISFDTTLVVNSLGNIASADRIPLLDTSKVATGVFDVARIPDLPLKANLESPSFTGTVQMPDETNVFFGGVALSIKADITYVDNAIAGVIASTDVTQADLDLKANIDNPSFTGSIGITYAGVLVVNSLGDIASADRIPLLDASKVTTGVFDVARIPDLPLKANVESPSFTGTVQLPAETNVSYAGVPLSTTLATKASLSYVDNISSSLGAKVLDTVVVVKDFTQLQQLQPNTIYLIDGVIDMGPHSINVPNGLVQIRGFSANVSTIKTTTPNSTLFVGGGNIFMSDIKLVAGGEGTRLFDLTDPTTFSAFEFFSVNIEDCTSLGIIRNFRQGFLFNGAIFGTAQGLCFAGTWRSGFRISNSIVRGMADGSNLFYEAEVPDNDVDSLRFGGRFISDANILVPANGIGYAFRPINFVVPCSFILNSGFLIGPGAYVSGITHTALQSRWNRNKGLPSTFPGAKMDVTTPHVLNIQTINVFVPFDCPNCVFSEMTWFENTSLSQIKYISEDPLDITINGVLNIISGNNNQIIISIRVYRDATGLYDIISEFKATTNGGNTGTRAENMPFLDTIIMNKNDYIELWFANTSSTTPITVEQGGRLIVSARE